ncbi:hypothetical protein P3T37_007208 [Kitasatospora sp. MAA4]|nr:hypothetical protein [Kitasatospora sp. MAA4]
MPTAANRQPAFAMYRRAPGKPTHEPFGIGVLRVEDGAVAEIATFLQPQVFASFALPTALRRQADASARAR